jgi:hypothetical protein
MRLRITFLVLRASLQNRAHDMPSLIGQRLLRLVAQIEMHQLIQPLFGDGRIE